MWSRSELDVAMARLRPEKRVLRRRQGNREQDEEEMAMKIKMIDLVDDDWGNDEWDEAVEEDGKADKLTHDLPNSAIPGAKPLERAMQEHFVQLIFQGQFQHDAYREAFGSKGNKTTLIGNAKNLLKKNHVKVRLDFLKGKLNSMTHSTERKDAIALCANIMRSPNKPSIVRLQALDRLAKMLHWFDAPPASTVDRRPDPAWFVEFVRKSKVAHSAGAETLLHG